MQYVFYQLDEIPFGQLYMKVDLKQKFEKI